MKVETIFQKAVGMCNANERAAYVAEACRDNPELQAEVQALLQAHEQAGDFLEGSPAQVTLDRPSKIDGPGTVIGRYQLLELIGEGGMGLVYLAEQKEPVKRRVAFKIIKPGMDSQQVIARFEAERQALAVLDHPNIAHVFDAGCTETGRPYFVMEYVKGMSITRYCDENKLAIEQRLRLFEQVCEAVHHAHQKGIIHRDLKPSNILVSAQGDKAVPKIIDFGIAKAITQPLTDKTCVTFQGQLLGTPEYMSPEQVDMGTQDIDTRSDIYSLGVVLYELLAGVLPFESDFFARAGLAEIQQTIREQEPASPSIRLTSLGEQAKTIAASRGTQVVPLARRLHRELEWIPLKAMRKDRCRRYRSASEMADDIRNYLTGLPLIAGPETTIYRVQKFVRKHAGSVATVALVATAIMLGLVVSTAMYFRSERALQRETAAHAEAEDARQKESLARGQAEKAEQTTKVKAEELRRALYANSIQLADVKYREGNTRRVRQLLESCPEDLRGWEWDRLNYIRDESVMTLTGTSGESIRPVLGKDDCIHAAMLNPDTKRIVSGHFDGTIRVWDSVTGKKLKEFRAHDQPLTSMAVSSDGAHIVSGSWDKTVKIWDTETSTEVRAVGGHKGAVSAVAISPDGKLVASSSGEGVFQVWEAQTGSQLMTLGNQKDGIKSVLFSPDGKRIISGDTAGDIKIWDTATGEMLTAIHAHSGSVRCVAVSSDGSQIASASPRDKSIRVWDTQKGVQLASFLADGEQVGEALAFSPDSKYIVSGWGNHIRIWKTETGSELRTLHGHEGWPSALAFTRDGQRIISSSWDGTVKLWDASGDHEAARLTMTQGTPSPRSSAIAFCPDGKRMASNADGMIKVWDMDSRTELMTLHRSAAGSGSPQRMSIAFSKDGTLMGASILGGRIKVWDAETNAEVMTLLANGQRFWDLAFTPDNKRLVTAIIMNADNEFEATGEIKIWGVPNGKEIMTLPLDGLMVPTSIAVSADGKYVAAGLFARLQAGEVKLGGAVKVWDTASGTEVVTMAGHDGPAVSVAFSPDCKLIASGNFISTADVWTATTGARLITLSGHDGAVLSVAFSSDGRRVITGSDDKTTRVWDVATGAELLSLPCDSDVTRAAFNANGTAVAVATGAGAVLLWESGAPAGGYEPRETGHNATQLVDKLYRRYGLYHDVIDDLSADKTLDRSVRRLALQVTNSRKWEDADKLRGEAWQTVGSSGKDAKEYQAALTKAEKANDWGPNDPAILDVLGAAQYRTGAYEKALNTVKTTAKLLIDSGDRPDPANLAFTAMSQRQLGQSAEAKTTLEQLRTSLKDERFAGDEQTKALLAEAEKLIERKKQ